MSGVVKFALAGFSALALYAAPAAQAASPAYKAGIDANGDGQLTLEEFVMAMAERDFKRFDKDGDNVMTVAEWVSNNGEFQIISRDRYNKDGDEIMSANELVEVYTWIFGNRDKDKSGQLTLAETPDFLLQK